MSATEFWWVFGVSGAVIWIATLLIFPTVLVRATWWIVPAIWLGVLATLLIFQPREVFG